MRNIETANIGPKKKQPAPTRQACRQSEELTYLRPFFRQAYMYTLSQIQPTGLLDPKRDAFILAEGDARWMRTVLPLANCGQAARWVTELEAAP